MLAAVCKTLRKANAFAGFSRGKNHQQLRFLNIHEHQSAKLMESFGINVPKGVACHSPEEVEAAVQQIGGSEVVVKSQILAGGRGLGSFTSGLKGGVHIVPQSEAREIASKMLGGTLVTKQTGPAGKPVNTVLVAEKMALAREMYFAILLDRSSAAPVIISCSEGGTSIEDLAHKFPDKIRRTPVDIREGITDKQALEVAEGLGIGPDRAAAAAEQVKALYRLFVERDCTLVEVNPIAETADGRLVAADAKLGFDDNAAFRQRELFALRDNSQEDPREVAAAKYDLNYIGLDGEIGCMVNGAGLAMATMDIIKLHGGTPANFLDVGGNASEEQVVEAFKILTADPKVKAILVNIFGGIMRCDVIASGVVNAAKQVGVNVPLVVRLEGTNVAEGKEILKQLPLVITADDLDDAAVKAVKSLA
uniref:Succinate--CoA ligase [ADP-forming] subunit beta, mitochondrial n=1 Tax=Tetraselmis sp. GSL018 TaxID=582737 RepID=A0A061S5H4_9CHLO|mmetsp:Transcript_13995/g.33067  ORF Transcript_13995/g.33067 Transcript_13995/m.33067 type:complete len:421 (+) Transcript_13995:138-1400(+)|eukprot:CAMPEP_0177604266 /NCGR_PEP_ID=MMETSP0419_2-20121207/16019_1 /TAXON_ID=582737 /ORGANISM="Tetraselmis sp., Strain GSL018" /LENGTH=420 /DNA_ID=CAMNT_0019098223 /DNA_START=79 /DNA_END=1341 /DNA_ORIENTATION=-